MTADAFQALLDEQGDWFHTFQFTNGCRTRGRDPSSCKLRALGLPDLRGRTLLDVGAYEGYFSFHAERLGAQRVVACDEFVWAAPGCNARSNFDLMRDVLSSSVEPVTCSVEALSPDNVGKFDIVLFLGVFYHTPNPVAYLQKIRDVTQQVLVLETLVDGLDIGRPAAVYYPAGSLNRDPTNWWGPNLACVLDLMQRLGFRHVQCRGLWDVNTVANLGGAVATAPPCTGVTSGRAVFHGYV